MRLPAIDGMRGVAAIVVALFHARDVLGWQPAPGGYLAVDLFFVLSGAVIVHAYAPRLATGMSLRAYMGRRLVRFLPLHGVGTIAGVAFALALRHAGSPDAMSATSVTLAAALHLAFLPHPLAAVMFPLNVPVWSLFYELLANALYGLAHRFCTPARLGLVAVVCGALLLMHGSANTGMRLGELPAALTRTLYSFTVGAWLVQTPLPSRSGTRMRLFAVLTCAVAPMLAPVGGTARTALDLAMVLAGFPLLARELLATPAREGAPTRIERALALLGDASFGVYALHWPLLWLWNGIARRIGIDPRPGVWLGIALLVLVCAWFERIVERPLRARLSARWFPAPR
jgi:peptidoglycan/LPS O-acetylase OafA/YrhL